MIQAAIILGGLGLAFGVILSLFHMKFRVEENPLVAAIRELLPGANCSACGYPGCANFAQALANRETSPEKCTSLNKENHSEICKKLGLEQKETVKMTARLFCSGGINANSKFSVSSIKDCRALNALFDTNLDCNFGCIGLGSCAEVCPVNCITMVNDLPVINEDSCISCGKCVEVCPKNIIRLVPYDKKVYVACSSHDKGGRAIKVCKIACIGCGKCIKACPKDAIRLESNLAVIDHEKCDNCGRCEESCPRKVIFIAPAKQQQLA